MLAGIMSCVYLTVRENADQDPQSKCMKFSIEKEFILTDPGLKVINTVSTVAKLFMFKIFSHLSILKITTNRRSSSRPVWANMRSGQSICMHLSTNVKNGPITI